MIFTGEKSSMLRSSNFGRAVSWRRAMTEVGVPAAFMFHDLRHTATPSPPHRARARELMHWMGHSSMQALQHATRERDREIEAVRDRISQHQGKKASKPKKRSQKEPKRRSNGRKWPGQNPKIRAERPRPDERCPAPGTEHMRAGDGNRTRTISLEDETLPLSYARKAPVTWAAALGYRAWRPYAQPVTAAPRALSASAGARCSASPDSRIVPVVRYAARAGSGVPSAPVAAVGTPPSGPV